MELYIDNRSGVPIYRQLRDQLAGQIQTGALPADAPLPSIRNLAKDLRISVITTKRVYEELERDGLIYTVPGKGCYVSENRRQAEQEDVLEGLLRQTAFYAKNHGLDVKRVCARLEEIMEELL